MITHQILRYIPADRLVHKQRFRSGSPEHRTFIFFNNLKYAKERFTPGDHVKVDGYPKRKSLGQVIDIIEDISDARWDGLKCKLVEVYMYDLNQTVLCHPSELKEASV